MTDSSPLATLPLTHTRTCIVNGAEPCLTCSSGLYVALELSFMRPFSILGTLSARSIEICPHPSVVTPELASPGRPYASSHSTKRMTPSGGAISFEKS